MGMAGTGMRYPLKKYGFNTALALKRFIIAIRLYNYDTHRKHMLAAQRDIYRGNRSQLTIDRCTICMY